MLRNKPEHFRSGKTWRGSALLRLLVLWCAGLPAALQAEAFISEVMFNPPGNPDLPNEYIELRGAPNAVLAPGTYFLSLE
ncbi:MAG TPA: hypothetical protein VNO52_18490, partial [Methylomirabilota bacterium]|nr:hypothetical protein [Methylomirabilota bacterium]